MTSDNNDDCTVIFDNIIMYIYKWFLFLYRFQFAKVARSHLLN